MKQSLIAGAVALVSILVVPQAIAQKDSAPAGNNIKAGSYKVEPSHTQVLFSVSHFGFTKFSGFFSGASGTLQLDPANPAADKLDVVIPIQSVLTTSSKLDDELKGDQWFDVAKFPTATFTSKKITPTGNGTASIAGDLTLHGVTKPITLNARFVGAGVNPLRKTETVGFEASGTIKRSDFGVKAYVPLVGDSVHLNIAGAFELQQ